MEQRDLLLERVRLALGADQPRPELADRPDAALDVDHAEFAHDRRDLGCRVARRRAVFGSDGTFLVLVLVLEFVLVRVVRAVRVIEPFGVTVFAGTVVRPFGWLVAEVEAVFPALQLRLRVRPAALEEPDEVALDLRLRDRRDAHQQPELVGQRGPVARALRLRVHDRRFRCKEAAEGASRRDGLEPFRRGGPR